MTSKKFFGSFKYKDINIEIFNENNELIYESHVTTFNNVNPIIKNEVRKALAEYRSDWAQNGEPKRLELFTTPAYNLVTIDLDTNKKTFTHY